jgi:hypothetical protein
MAEMAASLDRRASRRYRLHLPVQYRVSERGASAYSGSGMTCDMSTTGLSFRCRRSLPVGAHIEIVISWPSRYGDNNPVDLQLTGFIVRCDHGKFGIRVNSHRFVVDSTPAVQIAATA